MEPSFLDREAFTVMGVLIHSMPDQVDFRAFWENEFMPHHETIRALSTDGAYYGVWLTHHGDGIPDYVAGMAVPDDAHAPEGVIVRQVPAARYAVFECTMQTIGATYDHVYHIWLPASPYEFMPGGADFEYYPPEGATGTSPAVYIPIRDRKTAEAPADPEFLVGQMRVQTMREETFFCVVSQPTTMAGLDKELDHLMPKLEAAKAAAGIAQVGPVVIRYFGTGEPDTFVMEAGVPVKPGTQAAGEAQVKTLPPVRCASLLYWGSLEHIGQAYETLMQAMKAAGLEHSGEGREWYYHFEGDASPNNVIGLQMEIR